MTDQPARTNAIAPRDAAPAANTRRAYGADWADFTRWCRMQGTPPLPPDPGTVALYLADRAAGLAPGTVARRLSGLAWNARQRGFELDRADPRIAKVLAAIPDAPIRRKAALGPEDLSAMIATLPHDLRGLRDRAILLLGHAADLRRSEIVTLDIGMGARPESGGALTLTDAGAELSLRGRRGWRAIQIPRAATPPSCPVRAVEQWLHYARLTSGPVFRRVSRGGDRVLAARLSDRHVARLVKQAILASGLRADLPEAERLALFSGQSLRAARDSDR